MWLSCPYLHALAWSHACTTPSADVPCGSRFSSFCICALYLISPCRECIVNCCKTIFESWNECWLCCWSTIFVLWAPCWFIHICIETFTQRGPLLSASPLFQLWNWLRLLRRPRFSFKDLHADTRRVELLKCCSPMKTSVTRQHCDSRASESIAHLKQENNFYTCSCNYFQVSLFLWCLSNRVHIV